MEKKEWYFNEELLRDTINSGNNLLASPITSKEMKDDIRDTIIEFKNFLKAMNGESFNEEEQKSSQLSFKEYKEKILEKMNRESKMISSGVIDLIIYLEKRKSEISFREQYKEDVNIEELVEDTFCIYDTYFPMYKDSVFRILNHPFSLVHITKEKIFESECHGSSFIELPFIYICNVDENPLALPHEIQHGVEFMKSYKTHPYYYELGPIVLEELYTDYVVDKKSKNSELLYGNRLMEIDSILFYLSGYFEAMRAFQKLGWDVTDYKFLIELEKYDLALEETLNDDLEEMLEMDLKKYLCYVLSFLKSLDIRDNLYNCRRIGLRQLFASLENNKFSGLENKKDVLKNYENYIKEVSRYQKRRGKRINKRY